MTTFNLHTYQAGAFFGSCPTPIVVKDDETGLIKVPCGNCPRCSVLRQNASVGRMLGEAVTQGGGTVLTLTFRDLSDEFSLPDFWREETHRLRERMAYHLGRRSRYWLTAELGEERKRPHAHVVLFGPKLTAKRQKSAVLPFWQHGFCEMDIITPKSAKYCTKYVTDPAKRELVLFKGHSVKLGEKLFDLWCQDTARQVDLWGDEYLPRSWIYPVEHKPYPMDRRFRDIFEGYGLFPRFDPLMPQAEDLRALGPSIEADANFFEFQRAMSRKAECDAAFPKAPMLEVDGRLIKLR